MNGEMKQVCAIAATARFALRNGKFIPYTPEANVNSLRFALLPDKRGRQPGPILSGVDAWLAAMLERDLKQLYFICPTQMDERYLLTFPNINRGGILCIFKKAATLFTTDWTFDPKKYVWDVVYTEQIFERVPKGGIQFVDNTADFHTTLDEIRELALWLECRNFAVTFEKAAQLLDGTWNPPTGRDTPLMPAARLPLYRAAVISDVFGAMGSWNDAPPYIARAKGLSAEYDALSTDLLRNIRQALLFSLNVW